MIWLISAPETSAKNRFCCPAHSHLFPCPFRYLSNAALRSASKLCAELLSSGRES